MKKNTRSVRKDLCSQAKVDSKPLWFGFTALVIMVQGDVGGFREFNISADDWILQKICEIYYTMYFDDAICWKFQVTEIFSVWCYLVLDSFMNLNF
ncbi:hypothetical protein CUMW_233240 [Citrus unshiu]|uniref:Uncharacterized protein n=1 Tax=Citrus unshiu TaxID=55188 RepID=A0A2H5QIE2_CITUN|nr:hypothetical protein CUMW_233230 [Citrus unshiu]GAY64399.1 hypothetical protein CUMW_233240 [Citrus unshiu]